MPKNVKPKLLLLGLISVIVAFSAIGLAQGRISRLDNKIDTPDTASHGDQPIITNAPASQQGALAEQELPTTNINVPELGIILAVPPQLKDLTYYIDSKSVPGTTFAYFSTASLERIKDVTTQCSASQGAIGAIWRIAQDPTTIPDMHVEAYKKIGDSYVVYQAPQSGCSSNSLTQQLQHSKAKLLQETLSTATPEGGAQ